MAALALGGIANLGGNILNTIMAMRDASWNRDAMMNLYNLAQAGQGAASDFWRTSSFDPARWSAANTLNIGNTLTDMAPFLMQRGFELPEHLWRIGGQINPFMTPGMQQQADYVTGLQGGLNPGMATALQGFLGGGWTPQLQDIFDTATPFMRGAGSNAQISLGDVGMDLLGRRGQTAQSQVLQDRAVDAANYRGMNPDLQFGVDRAKDILATGGMSPELRTMLSAVLPSIAAGGRTAGSQAAEAAGLRLLNQPGTETSRALQSRGLELFNRTPDLTTGQALTFAQEGANKQTADLFNRVMRQAINRGGQAGTIVGGGTRNQMLADTADIASQNAAQAVRDELMKQQQLQLSMMGMGLQGAGQGAGIETTREGIGASLLPAALQAAISNLSASGGIAGDILRTGAGRESTAFGSIPGMQNTGANIMQALLQAGDAAAGRDISRMQTGGNLIQNLLASQQGFGGLLQSGIGTGVQNALGLGGLFNTMTGTGGNLSNNLFGNLLGSGQLGASSQNNLMNALISGQNAGTSTYGALGGVYGTGLGNMTNLAGQASNLNSDWIKLLGAPFGGVGSNTGSQSRWNPVNFGG